MIRELGADEVVADGAASLENGGADVLLATSNSWAPPPKPRGHASPMAASWSHGRRANEPLNSTRTHDQARVSLMGSSQNGPEYLYEALDYAAKGKVKVVEETTSSTTLAKPTTASPKAKSASGP
jgi:alcohol dehydrogenase